MTGCQAFMSMPCVTFRLDFLSNRSVVSSSVHFRYIYNTSQSSFLHFSAKTHCQSATVNLVRAIHRTYIPVDHTTVDLQLLQRTVSIAILIYKSCIWQLYLARSTQPSILLDPSILGFIVNCRKCLVRRVISQWFVTRRNTRKYTRPVIKTKRVPTKRGVRPPLPRPQQTRIWRWLK